MTAHAATLGGPRDRVFYTGMGIVALVTVFIGFAPTFYLRGAELPPLSPLLVTHGVIFSLWYLLFIAQTSLVAANRRQVHRKVGAGTVALAAVMTVVGLMASVDALRRGVAIGDLDPRSFFAIPFFDMIAFPLLVAAAFWFRHSPETHKRLMLVASLNILDAAFARFPLDFVQAAGPLAFFPLVDALIVAGMAYDFATRRRVHAAYFWGLGIVLAFQALRLVISGTPAWLSFAELFLAA